MQFQIGKGEAPVHFFLRIPSGIETGGKAERIIEEHNIVFRQKKKVFFCKFGTLPNVKFINQLSSQISRNVNTFVYFSARRGKDFIGFRASLNSISTRRPGNELNSCTPNYYNDSTKNIDEQCLWLELGSEIIRCELSNLKLLSNKKPVLEVLFATRTPSMMVQHS